MTDLLTRIERGEPVEAQEIFDYSVGKVLKQGAPALVDGHCKYRTPKGRVCAFGALIPNSLYRKRFEDGTAKAVLVEGCDANHYSAKLAVSLAGHIRLISDLQSAHDYAATYMGGDFVAMFRHRAEAVAKEHGLTFKF
jgi:hypothetical protein